MTGGCGHEQQWFCMSERKRTYEELYICTRLKLKNNPELLKRAIKGFMNSLRFRYSIYSFFSYFPLNIHAITISVLQSQPNTPGAIALLQ
jgi:hypothetical protein